MPTPRRATATRPRKPSTSTRAVALLRGINVGGNNLVRMSDLVACLEAEGFSQVETYIASGNVLFSTPEKDVGKLTLEIEGALKARLKLPLSVVLRTEKAMRQTVQRAPEGFGKDPARYLYDAVFLKESLTAKAALKELPIKDGVDAVAAGPGVLYFSRLRDKATQSKLSRVASLTIYKQMTIRNWNTTTKLLALMEREKLGKTR
jgi:uncharacterized protein (DUF1697 family)